MTSPSRVPKERRGVPLPSPLLLFLLLLLLPGRSNSSTANAAAAEADPSTSSSSSSTPPPPSEPGPYSESDVDLDWHVRTTTSYSYAGTSLVVEAPSTDPSHAVLLFLGRTDGSLPLKLGGAWTRLGKDKADCFKSRNRQRRCYHADYDCSLRRGRRCVEFRAERRRQDGGRGRYKYSSGRNLATVVYWRLASPQRGTYKLHLGDRLGGHASWAIATAVRTASLGGDVDGDLVVRDVSTASCDDVAGSRFPSVRYAPGDILLLSQAYDDAAARSGVFDPPFGTELIGHVGGTYDETGFLYGARLTAAGFGGGGDITTSNNAGSPMFETGDVTTRGTGGSPCKDALIAMTITTTTAVRPRQ